MTTASLAKYIFVRLNTSGSCINAVPCAECARFCSPAFRTGSGEIPPNPATLVTPGDLRQPAAVLALLGFVLIAALNYRKLLGGTLIGILCRHADRRDAPLRPPGQARQARAHARSVDG
jgi:xanthine/uracil/vitamin C permease (AzgA family)